MRWCDSCGARLVRGPRARFCGPACKQKAYRRRLAGLPEHTRRRGRRGRLRLDQPTKEEAVELGHAEFWRRVDEATRFPHGDGSYGGPGTITVIDIGSEAERRMIAEYERKAQAAAVRRAWRLDFA
jgi:hypothetical protein